MASSSVLRNVTVKCEGRTFVGRGVAGRCLLKNYNPVVLLFPDYRGCKSLDFYRCLLINRLYGCSVVAVDLYGETFPPHQREDPTQRAKAGMAMNSLLIDPAFMRKLMNAFIVESVNQLNGDIAHTAAIGFCFGGVCVMELVRDCSPLKVAVTMHGVMDCAPRAMDGGAPPPTKSSVPPPKYSPECHLLVCHGASDPVVPEAYLRKYEKEIQEANLASCTFCSYSKAVHGFTTPNANPNSTTAFDVNAARRAWVSAFDLISQAFDMPILEPIPKELWKNADPISEL